MQDRRVEELLFQRWIPIQSEINFDEFKKQVVNKSNAKLDTRSGIEIIKDIRERFNKLQEEGAYNGVI